MLPLDGLSTYSLEQMSDEEFWNYARQRASVASRISFPEQDDQDQYLECKLSSGYCLLPLRAIIEVVPPPHRFARLPSTPGWMCGIAAWHGETIAVIDLDLYLSGTGNSSPDAMLLVASHAELTIGLLVPGVGQTTTVQLEQMMPATALECEPATHFASAGSKGSPLECEPATHFVLRFASAGSKGSPQEDVVRGIYDGRTVLDAPALLSDVALALIPTGNGLRPSFAQPVGEVVQQIERAAHNG
jgi:chemotaxis signal transduction protein